MRCSLKKYEAIFILDLRKVEDEGKAFAEEFSKLIQGWGGVVNETVAMGRRQFAREINKRKAGVYLNFVFEVEAEKETQIRESYRLDDRVLRIMIINYDRPANVRSTLAPVESSAPVGNTAE